MGEPHESRSWSTPLGLVVTGWVLVAAAAVWWLLSTEAVDRLFIGVIALALLALTGYATACRPRLRADPHGVTVHGLRGRRRFGWSEVTPRTHEQRRHGRTTRTVELETTGGELFVLGRFDLGADPEDVAAELERLHRERGT
ncbi:PH domain-containing protein [Bounagaea algeriensis]